MVRFEALAFLPWTFPNGMKFKCWCTYAPSSLGLTMASTHLLTYGLWSVLCPTTAQTVSPPSAQSPFAQSRCYPGWGIVYRFLGRHYSSFFAPTDSFASRSGL